MDGFLSSLKARAQARRWDWKVIPRGGRSETYEAFSNATEQYPDELIFLLVDAEESVSGTPIQHLRRRENWALVLAERIHLMAQTMEAWIVADAAALSDFYGQHFQVSALPRAANLETVPKSVLESSLEQATRHSSKGHYHKISHASRLLQRLDSQKVRTRCPHCERFFVTLESLIP